MVELIIIPLLFAVLDRMRGTDSTLVVAGRTVGYSVFYSAAVGMAVWHLCWSATAGALAAVLFFAGELRNWREQGYYLNGSHGIATVAELVFRGFVWYGPTFVMLWYFGHITLQAMLWNTVTASLAFWISIIISEKLWQRYADALRIEWRWFHVSGVWTLNECVRGFLFGVILVASTWGASW